MRTPCPRDKKGIGGSHPPTHSRGQRNGGRAEFWFSAGSPHSGLTREKTESGAKLPCPADHEPCPCRRAAMSGPGPDSDSFGPSRVPSIRKRCLFRRPAGLSFRWCPEGTFEPHLFLGDSLPGLVFGRPPAVPAVARGWHRRRRL